MEGWGTMKHLPGTRRPTRARRTRALLAFAAILGMFVTGAVIAAPAAWAADYPS